MTANWPKPTHTFTLSAHNVSESLLFFESSIAHIRTSLTELELSPSYLMLTDANPGGETARRYGKAAKEANDLWPLTNGAGYQVEAARAYIEEYGSKGKHGHKIVEMLQERFGVVLGASSRPISITVPEALDRIHVLFSGVQAGIDEIDALWAALLPRVKAATETVEELQVAADRLGIVEPLIGRTRALALDLADRLTSDPLSVTAADGPALDVKVNDAITQVATARSGHDNLAKDLVRAAQLVANLRVLRSRAESARETTLEKIVEPSGLIRVPSGQIIDGPEGLASRLEKINGTGDDQEWIQRRSVLDMWLRTATKLNEQLERAEAANKGPLEKRDELRGRLQAYQAKAAGMGHAEDLELMGRFEDARSVLYTSPTDLSVAEVSLQELAARLRT